MNEKNPERAIWMGAPSRDRIREIWWQFPIIGDWIYDKRDDPDKRTARRAQRWQFIGTR
jgi:hypothetical protein